MSQSGFKTAEIIDLEALANAQASSDHVVESVVSEQVGKTVAVGTGNGETATNLSSTTNSLAPVAENRGLTTSLAPLDLSRPVKTEGEASASLSTVSQPPPTGGASLLPVSQPSVTLHSGSPASTPGDASGSSSTGALPASITNIGTFGSPLSSLGTQLNLTAEEQSAAYKKANIIALSALAKKGGPNARNMLAVQAKLQEFLTNLIALAGNSGQELKSTVQMLVQQLVTGSISEQEFAMRIEKDLHSQHQPSLLPFLQSSVPHLRTRLQLQQAIMKELLQRQAQEKLQQKIQEQKLGSQGGAAVSLGNDSSSNSVHRVTENLRQVNTSGTLPLVRNSGGVKPQALNQPQKMNSVSVTVSTPSSSSSSSSSTSSSSLSLSVSSSSATSSVPLPISTTSITAQLREQLAKLTPQQRALYMQQLTSSSLQAQKQQNSQPQSLQQQVRLATTAAAVASVQAARGFGNAKVSISPLNSHSSSSTSSQVKITAQPQTNLNQQQQQPQAQISVGGVAVKQISSRSIPLTTSSNHLAGGKVVVGSNVSPSKGGLRTGFVDVKLAPGVTGKISSPPTGQAGKGKGKMKVEKSVADDEEEEDDDIDFSGVKTVNLQAESILPSHLGDTMRTVRDEAFFDVQALRRKVSPIARRYGISEITDEYLVLLSHGIQERLKDIMEKVTVVSQHRTEALKDEGLYEMSSEVRGQLKILESIDRLSHRRKMEKEKDQILKAARSRSRPDDPEAAAKIKEQAKKLQQEEAQKIRDKRANEAALAALSAIGSGTKRKRPSGAEGVSSNLSGQDTGSGPSLLGTQTSRQPKRRITARDLLFYMEQTKETKKSLVLYKSLLK